MSGYCPAKVPDQRVGVLPDVRTGQASVGRETAFGNASVGQARNVFEFRFPELDPVTRRDGRLNLKVDLQSPGPGGLEELLDHGAVLGGQAVRGRGLIAQTVIEAEIGAKARSRPDPELPLSPERPIQQADLPGSGVDGRLPETGLRVGQLHHVRRSRHRRGRGPTLQVVEHTVDGLALEVLGQQSDADEI